MLVGYSFALSINHVLSYWLLRTASSLIFKKSHEHRGNKKLSVIPQSESDFRKDTTLLVEIDGPIYTST